MATPIAHASAGLACLALVHLALPGRLKTPLTGAALACAFAACAPDLDIAVSLIATGHPTTWHSGPTHTVAFAALVGILAAWALRRRPGGLALALAIGLATASHVLVDFLTGPDWGWHRSFGVPAWWPWITERLTSPFTVFRGVKHGSVAIWFNAHNLTTAASELIFALPVVALSWRWLSKPRITASPTASRTG
jgi:membrane-bound metal-dependent hydrolase YbcI (DUF457 family)